MIASRKNQHNKSILFNNTIQQAMKNTVQLIGHVGKNPEIKTSSNGKKYATFSLATSERMKQQDGTYKDNTTWHNILLWENRAELAEKYIVKGSMLGIQARLTNRQIKNADGSTRNEYALQVLEMMMLGGKRGGDQSATPNMPANSTLVSAKDIEENLPF
jgi:single-strand DNA-binding protein